MAVVTSLAGLLFAAGPAVREKKFGPGVTVTEIKGGQTMPYSGPLSCSCGRRWSWSSVRIASGPVNDLPDP